MTSGHEDALTAITASSTAGSSATRSEGVVTQGGDDVLNPSSSRGPHHTPPPSQVRDPLRYHIVCEHGRGGLGRVSRAHDRSLGRDVAIKELLSPDAVNEVRFLREALITARLEHPGIVPVHEAGRWPDGTPFYAMKLVSGRSLRDLIAECTTVDQRIDLIHHVIAVADAIAYAHGRNIIHRDLKPSNVIVGAFGETVVIDWGLAKDLSVAEPSEITTGARSAARSAELTSTGTILGTPAYMAPEQGRGEHVDQRADVFAIGAMLWELCAAQKAPPEDAQVRRRMLSRSGIDDDLATIINKALDSDPDRRYRDAGELASDLKAFKSGARIAARRYSLAAMLAHWTRRHRTLASSIAAMIAIAVIGSLLYVRNVTSERDRADASEDAARRARASTQSALDELTLNHAELQLATDPSAAIDTLASYRGSDRTRADQIRAEAIGRGVAKLRTLPHATNVLWSAGAADGAVLSLSMDGTIARTQRDGAISIVTRGVSTLGLWAYAPSRHLLAYPCDPSDLCFLDTARAARLPLAAMLRGVQVADLSFSPGGALLAVLSRDAILRVFNVSDPAAPTVRLTRPAAGSEWVKFIDDDVVATASHAGAMLIRLSGESEPFAYSDPSFWDASASDHQLVIGTTTGQAVVLSGFPLRVVARSEPCHGLIIGLQFIPGRHSVAYACRDGAIGIWDVQRGAVDRRMQLEGNADLVTTSADGDYVIASSGTGAISVLDLATDIIASYKGHKVRLTRLTPPTAEYPFLISADARGALRVWPLAPRLARVVATSSMPFNAAIFDRRSAGVMATTWLPELTTYRPEIGARTVKPHDAYHPFLESTASGKAFAAYGLHDLIEIWDADSLARTRVIATGQGSVSQLHFIGDSDDFITSGHDGRVVRWTAAGEQLTIAQFDQAVDGFVQTATGALVAGTADGALWRIAEDGRPVALRGKGPRIGRMIASPDRRTVYIGYADGNVLELDATSWQAVTSLRAGGAVLAISTTSNGQTVAVASDDGAIHFATRSAAAAPGSSPWTTIAALARHVALTPDGLIIATYSDGTIWLYAPETQRWLCLVTGAADINRTVVAGDGKAAVALDRGGRLLWIDLEAARQELRASVPRIDAMPRAARAL
jgi:WD40 repeat protein